MMANRTQRLKFGRRNEEDLLHFAKDALPSDFPNPERLGCPEATTLDAIAKRRLSIPYIDDVVDHIATCSPCFGIYSEYRKRYCSRNSRKRSIAGLVILAVLIAIWFFGTGLLAPPKYRSAQLSEVAPETAVVDFRDRTSERSDQARARQSMDAPHLRRSVLNIQILLPLGTEEGQYSLQFRNSAGVVATQSTGTAKWDGITETLSVRVDLRSIEPGQYILAVRKGASSWRQFSVFVD